MQKHTKVCLVCSVHIYIYALVCKIPPVLPTQNV